MLLSFCFLSFALCPVSARPGAKSCQMMGFGSDYRLDTKSGQCHETWTVGPCGYLPDVMTYVPIDDVYGECSCAVPNMRVWPADNMCYFLNSQGPCKLGYRFKFNSSGDPPECEVDANCYDRMIQTGSSSWVSKDGECYEEGKRGHPCPDHEILMLQGYEETRCVDLRVVTIFGVQPDTGGARQCNKAQQTVPSYLGGCLPAVQVLDGTECPEGFVHHPAYDEVCVQE